MLVHAVNLRRNRLHLCNATLPACLHNPPAYAFETCGKQRVCTKYMAYAFTHAHIHAMCNYSKDMNKAVSW
jgi:hypothetical protein